MLKFVSFLWPLLCPDALLGYVYMTIHIKVCFIFEHHSAQKNYHRQLHSASDLQSQLFLTDLYFFWFFGSPFQVGETGKRKKVIFFSHSRQDIATLPLQCMVVAALSSGKLVLRRSGCRGTFKAKFCLLCIFVKIFWLSVYRLTCITVSS